MGAIFLPSVVFKDFTEIIYRKPYKKTILPICQGGFIIWIYSDLNLSQNVILDMKLKNEN